MAAELSTRWVLRTACTATVRERWVLTAERAISRHEAIDRLINGEEDFDVECVLVCTDEEIENEEGRIVLQAFADDLGEPIETVCPNCGGQPIPTAPHLGTETCPVCAGTGKVGLAK